MPLEFLEFHSDFSNGNDPVCARNVACQQHSVFFGNLTLFKAVPELGDLLGGGSVACPLLVAGMVAELDGVEGRDFEAEGLEDKGGDGVAYVAENYLCDGLAGRELVSLREVLNVHGLLWLEHDPSHREQMRISA